MSFNCQENEVRPQEEFPGSVENYRELLRLLGGWKCCNAPALCGVSCQDTKLSSVLALAYSLVLSELDNGSEVE